MVGSPHMFERTSTLHGSLVTGKPGCEPQIQAVSPQCTTRSCLRSGPFPRTSAEIWDNESPRLAAGSLSACAAAAASSRLCRVTPAPGASARQQRTGAGYLCGCRRVCSRPALRQAKRHSQQRCSKAARKASRPGPFRCSQHSA